jgi:hypothetical protein
MENLTTETRTHVGKTDGFDGLLGYVLINATQAWCRKMASEKWEKWFVK